MVNEAKGRRPLLRGYWSTAVIVVLFLAAYTLATDVAGALDKILFPGPSRIGRALLEAMPRLWDSLLSSMGLLIPAFSLAALTGIALGVAIGLHPRAHHALKPIIFAMSPLPPSMLTPYFIAIMPTFYISSVAIIFLGCFWPFLSGTISGILLTDQKYLDNAKVLEMTGWRKLLMVILPAAAPHILNGAATALNFAFILLTVAEMFATDSGLGYFVQYYADFSDYARVIAGLLFTIAVFVTIMLAFDRLRRKLLFWMIGEDNRT